MKTTLLAASLLFVAIAALRAENPPDPPPLSSPEFQNPFKITPETQMLRRMESVERVLERILRQMPPKTGLVVPAAPDNLPEHRAAAEKWLQQYFRKDAEIWSTGPEARNDDWKISGLSIVTNTESLSDADKLNGAAARFNVRFTAAAAKSGQSLAADGVPIEWKDIPRDAVWHRTFTLTNGNWNCRQPAPFFGPYAVKRESPKVEAAAGEVKKPRFGLSEVGTLSRRPIDFEARLRHEEAWDQYFLYHEGSWFSRVKDGSIVQMVRPRLKITNSGLTEAQTLNGLLLQSTSAYDSGPHRFFKDDKWSEWRDGRFSPPSAPGQFGPREPSILIEFRDGKWNATPDPNLATLFKTLDPKELPPLSPPGAGEASPPPPAK